MDINYIKNYLRVDHDEDDELIENMFEGCIAYLEPILADVVGVYPSVMYNNFYDFWESEEDKRIKLVDIYLLAMLKEMYDNRGLMTTDKAAEKVKYCMSHILTQLQYS